MVHAAHLLIAAVLLVVSSASPVAGESFSTPPALRARVDFWKKVFCLWGQDHFVVHHRMYPYIVFKEVDISPREDDLRSGLFKERRAIEEEISIRVVKEAIDRLAAGYEPLSDLERRIEREMRVLGPGTNKYRRVLDEDLIRTQTGIRERYALAILRAQQLLPRMERIFLSYGLPIELTRLPFIESSFDSSAVSSAGAAGIWQFMRPTAKHYGLRVTSAYDERRDPIASTHAAARYLRDAYQQLGSWPLAITSYNHGVGGLRNKIASFGSADLVTMIEHPTVRPLGFASTNFYPEFLAAVEVYRDWRRYFPEIASGKLTLDTPIYTTAVVAKTATSSAAGKIGRAGSSRPKKGVTLRHAVRRGESLEQIARKYGRSVAELRAANRLRGSHIVAGQTLVIPSSTVPTAKRSSAATRGSDTREKKSSGGKRTSDKTGKNSKKAAR